MVSPSLGPDSVIEGTIGFSAVYISLLPTFSKYTPSSEETYLTYPSLNLILSDSGKSVGDSPSYIKTDSPSLET